MLIKFLLSAFDISAKLYPPQEQEESPSLQRGAHSVTCDYGIYCRVKRCLGCTCRPTDPHGVTGRQPPVLADSKQPDSAHAHRGRAAHLLRAVSAPPTRCRPRPPPEEPASGMSSVKNSFFNEKDERPEPCWVRSPAGCWGSRQGVTLSCGLTRLLLLAGPCHPSGSVVPSGARTLLKDI